MSSLQILSLLTQELNHFLTSQTPSSSIFRPDSLQPKMGLSSTITRSHYHTQIIFLHCNYILLGAASSCIFLTLSLRLFPSPCGFFIILLHLFTIAGAVSGCTAASVRWFGTHMVSTVLTAIFQGSVSVLVFTRTGDFLEELRSYVREEDGSVILKLGGGLSILIFCLEWVVLTLAFFLKYYAIVERESMKTTPKFPQDWPWPPQL